MCLTQAGGLPRYCQWKQVLWLLESSSPGCKCYSVPLPTQSRTSSNVVHSPHSAVDSCTSHGPVAPHLDKQQMHSYQHSQARPGWMNYFKIGHLIRFPNLKTNFRHATLCVVSTTSSDLNSRQTIITARWSAAFAVQLEHKIWSGFNI